MHSKPAEGFHADDSTVTLSRLGAHRAGRHFVQIPGPTNVPARVLDTIARPTIDHRGPEFVELASFVLPCLRKVFKTDDDVVVNAASGTGAWEAALVNLFSAGDTILSFDNWYFAGLWADVARRLGLKWR